MLNAMRVRQRIVWGLFLTGALLCPAIFPAVSSAASEPHIGITSVEFGESSATLTALIRPEGAETKYEFWLEGETALAEVGEGYISASRLEQEVSAHVSTLKPSHTYTYRVIASNSAGSRTSSPLSFTTGAAPPPGCPYGCSSEPPYEFHEEPSLKEGAEREAAEAPRLEAERQARKREEEERPAGEAAALAAREGEVREAVARESKPALSTLPKCVVPALKNDSLAAARRAVGKAHCALGRVRKPSRHGDRLVVRTQSVRAGRELALGAAVGVRLGPAPRRPGRR
jgi:hypothetical protein